MRAEPRTVGEGPVEFEPSPSLRKMLPGMFERLLQRCLRDPSFEEGQ